jgi:serine/threonine-protein kinase
MRPMKKSGREAPASRSAAPAGWVALAALSAVSALWSLFLWAELVVTRSGGRSFCGFGGRFDCAAVWDGALASAVHRFTGLPLAGWGLAWSVVLLSLSLAGLFRLASGRGPGAPLTTAVRLTAAAGAAVAAVLLVSSLADGVLCAGCIGTYALVGAAAAIAVIGWRDAGWGEPARGGTLAAACAAGSFAILLYPGLHTPKPSGEAGRQAVAAASGAPLESTTPAQPQSADPALDRQLRDLIAALDPSGRQTLADSLAIYRASRPVALPASRALVGPSAAPVRITEFTDVLCDHCADLQQTLEQLRRHTPPGSFSVDARHFPLDGRCNPKFESGTGDDVRCVAAAARICAEPLGHEPELAAALFERQHGLTRAKALEIAARFVPRPVLEACIASPATRAKLEQDLAAAEPFDSDGTPIVAVNGRRGTSYGPFLYALILTRGDPDHPAFGSLPPGDPAAHLH